MVCSRSPLAWPTAKRGLRPSYRKIVEPCLDAVAHGGNPQDRANHAINKYLTLFCITC
ncbi:hypothetical protein [Moorena producens]|uniref:hypothetical protein n=1 Tax=Moorena producens TaxID=1155739 RepID=UPI003C720660